MSSMLKAARSAAFLNRISTNGSIKRTKLSASTRLMATQSGDDTQPPSAIAKLHLEDGSTLTGRSFGCHESMTGEVRYLLIRYIDMHSRLHSDVVDMSYRCMTYHLSIFLYQII